MKQLIECVPNFSEGNDLQLIKQITDAIESIDGITLLNVDPGKATNRTVVTFVGVPEAVIQAAFCGIKKAQELIDMSKHKGEHPRMGATDVCPLIPVSNISMDETAQWAHKLAKMVGDELHIPVYLYEAAQANKKRSNLSVIREGEYEGFAKKMENPEWKPDFGPSLFNLKSGATVIGSRDFLVAFNVNLNTTSTRRANAIAFDVRENGRVKREGNSVTGKIINDANGHPVIIPGSLKSVKAIGWFIKEYGIAQISMNLTNVSITPMHIAFEEVCKKAQERGIRVTGSELVGVVPLNSMLDAGRYFLKKQQRSVGISEAELIKIAVKSLGLDELVPFNPQEKILEYVINKNIEVPLVKMNLTAFADETASESPAPGGGSISAYVGTLGISLATMVANLSSHKLGWDERWEEFSNWAEKGQIIKNQLLQLVDKDTAAFNLIMDAFALPKATDEEKKQRKQAIQAATKNAILVPLHVMQLAFESMTIIEAMIKTGNPNSLSDAGVGALCARTAVLGAAMNVKINTQSFEDKIFVKETLTTCTNIETKTMALETALLKEINDRLKIVNI